MPENRDVRVCEAANTPVECSSEKTVLRQQDGEASPRQVLLEVKDLEVTYGSGRKAFKAVNRANFEIYKGETFGLVGESGSGKTTIGRAIMRILPTSGGEILYKGQKINGKISRQLDQQVIKEIQMIFQDPQSSLNERAKVSYIVGEGLQNVRPDLTAAQRELKNWGVLFTDGGRKRLITAEEARLLLAQGKRPGQDAVLTPLAKEIMEGKY